MDLGRFDLKDLESLGHLFIFLKGLIELESETLHHPLLFLELDPELVELLVSIRHEFQLSMEFVALYILLLQLLLESSNLGLELISLLVEARVRF